MSIKDTSERILNKFKDHPGQVVQNFLTAEMLTTSLLSISILA